MVKSLSLTGSLEDGFLKNWFQGSCSHSVHDSVCLGSKDSRHA